MPRLLPLVLVSALLAGCGTSDDRTQVRSVVERFYDAVRHDQADVACEQLSKSTRDQLESQTEQSCAGVITRLDYEGGAIADARVYLTNAVVALRSGERAFLTRESEGWRLSGIGCEPTEGLPRDRPFDCEAEA